MTRRLFPVGLILLLCFGVMAGEDASILFIGNSYTAGMRGTFVAMTGQLKDRKVTLDFVIKNGCTSVFMKALLGLPLEDLRPEKGVTEPETQTILKAVKASCP